MGRWIVAPHPDTHAAQKNAVSFVMSRILWSPKNLTKIEMLQFNFVSFTIPDDER
jgi:hypothetical protein